MIDIKMTGKIKKACPFLNKSFCFILFYPFAVTIAQLAVIFQLATPLIIGVLIALQFGFDPMRMMVVAGASFVGSGVVKFTPDLGETGDYAIVKRLIEE